MVDSEGKATVPPVAGPLLTLRKILELDQRYQYADRAVVGGVSAYANRWLSDVQRDIANPPPAWVTGIADSLRAYSAATPQTRQEIVTTILRLIERPGTASNTKAPSPKPGGAPSQVATPSRSGSRPTPTVRSASSAANQNAVKTPPAAPPARRTGATKGPALATQTIPGIGPAYAKLLAKLGIHTVTDLLYHLPHRYLDYREVRRVSDLAEGITQTLRATVWEAHSERTMTGKKRVVAVLGDETGTIEAIWWNQAYLLDKLSTGRQIVMSGVPSVFRGKLQFSPSDWEFVESGELLSTARLAPVHPLTEGLNGPWLRRKIKECIDRWAPSLEDALPEAVRDGAGLMPLPLAIAQVHFPDDDASLKAARRRLAFDEFLLVQLGLMRRRRQWRIAVQGIALAAQPQALDRFRSSLPFTPTGAQKRVISEILADMEKPAPMLRLLQGDVGSGKTMVAATAMVLAAANGYQSVLMAPTEVLAEQHHRTLTRMLGPLAGDITGEPVMLTGSVTGSARTQAMAAIAGGEAKIIVGTQALIQGNVVYSNLGLAIVDEQHRFGVEQRSALSQKGANPHLLVMTATPIPRTLSLTIYGDLDISIIDELPPGRQEIETLWYRPEQRRTAYGIVRREVAAGHQAFVMCPLVEESDTLEAKAATVEHARLQKEVFPDLRVGLLHGRMRPKQKDEVMAEFRDGKMDILVTTPVVEVGIDIPNATVMLVEGADRFGLAQLHQFRGRVGRGPSPSRCLLLADSFSFEAGQRLQAIVNTTDGFKLAEADLELRGPGEFLGTRQSGLPDLKVARLSDLSTLEIARQAAAGIIERDPEMANPEHRLLAQRLQAFWQQTVAGA